MFFFSVLLTQLHVIIIKLELRLTGLLLHIKIPLQMKHHMVLWSRARSDQRFSAFWRKGGKNKQAKLLPLDSTVHCFWRSPHLPDLGSLEW